MGPPLRRKNLLQPMTIDMALDQGELNETLLSLQSSPRDAHHFLHGAIAPVGARAPREKSSAHLSGGETLTVSYTPRLDFYWYSSRARVPCSTFSPARRFFVLRTDDAIVDWRSVCSTWARRRQMAYRHPCCYRLSSVVRNWRRFIPMRNPTNTSTTRIAIGHGASGRAVRSAGRRRVSTC